MLWCTIIAKKPIPTEDFTNVPMPNSIMTIEDQGKKLKTSRNCMMAMVIFSCVSEIYNLFD